MARQTPIIAGSLQGLIWFRRSPFVRVDRGAEIAAATELRVLLAGKLCFFLTLGAGIYYQLQHGVVATNAPVRELSEVPILTYSVL